MSKIQIALVLVICVAATATAGAMGLVNEGIFNYTMIDGGGGGTFSVDEWEWERSTNDWGFDTGSPLGGGTFSVDVWERPVNNWHSEESGSQPVSPHHSDEQQSDVALDLPLYERCVEERGQGSEPACFVASLPSPTLPQLLDPEPVEGPQFRSGVQLGLSPEQTAKEAFTQHLKDLGKRYLRATGKTLFLTAYVAYVVTQLPMIDLGPFGGPLELLLTPRELGNGTLSGTVNSPLIEGDDGLDNELILQVADEFVAKFRKSLDPPLPPMSPITPDSMGGGGCVSEVIDCILHPSPH